MYYVKQSVQVNFVGAFLAKIPFLHLLLVILLNRER